MRFDDKGLEAAHKEILDGMEWFLKGLMAKGMPQEQARMSGNLLASFFQSLPAFAGLKKCESCHGRGHNNLIVLGSKEPSACTDCGGTGYARD